MRFRFSEKSMPASTSMRMPAEAMIPKSRMQMPPITCTGMLADGRAHRAAGTTWRWRCTAAPPMTHTLKTRVIAMTPMFSP